MLTLIRRKTAVWETILTVQIIVAVRNRALPNTRVCAPQFPVKKLALPAPPDAVQMGKIYARIHPQTLHVNIVEIPEQWIVLAWIAHHILLLL